MSPGGISGEGSGVADGIPRADSKAVAKLLDGDLTMVSIDARALGVAPTRQGQPRMFMPAEVLKMLLARRLAKAGLPRETALGLVAPVSLDELRKVIQHQRRRWFAVTPDPSGQAEFVTRIIKADELRVFDLMNRGKVSRMITVDLLEAGREALAACIQAEREAKEAEEPAAAAVRAEQPEKVTRFRRDHRVSGLFLRASGRLDCCRQGAGFSFHLTAAELRELAAAAIEVAETLEPSDATRPAPETHAPGPPRRPSVN